MPFFYVRTGANHDSSDEDNDEDDDDDNGEGESVGSGIGVGCHTKKKTKKKKKKKDNKQKKNKKNKDGGKTELPSLFVQVQPFSEKAGFVADLAAGLIQVAYPPVCHVTPWKKHGSCIVYGISTRYCSMVRMVCMV